MTFRAPISGYAATNSAGRIAKYLATSLAIEKVVRQPRVIRSCLPTSTTSSSLVGLLSRSTMLPASRAAWVPRVHGDGDVGLGEGRRVVGAVAGHRHQLALRLLGADQVQLHLRAGLGEEVVDAGLGGDGRGGERVVAGDHHRAQAHRAQAREALGQAALDHVLEADDAEHAAAVGHGERRAARPGDLARGLRDRPAARCRRATSPTSRSRRWRPCGSGGRRGRTRSCGSRPRTG